MKEAPARISMIMQVMRVVPITLCQNESQLRVPDHQAMASEPATPQAAHSVAVAQPRRSDRKTRAINSRHGIRLTDSLSFFLNGMCGSRGGVRSGCARDQTAM